MSSQISRGNTPVPQNWGGGNPLPLGMRVHRPTYSELPRPLPPIRSKNIQRDFTYPSYVYIFVYFWCYYS